MLPVAAARLVGPVALYGLLFTIVILFALQGDAITKRPWDVARIALPLLAYFAIMWAGSFALGRGIGLGYARTTTLTMSCGDACPVYPGRRYEDWRLDDPAGRDVAAVRPIRDAIRERVAALLTELLPGGSA